MYLIVRVHIEPNGRHQTHVRAVFFSVNQLKIRPSRDLASVPMHHSAVKSEDSAKTSDYEWSMIFICMKQK